MVSSNFTPVNMLFQATVGPYYLTFNQAHLLLAAKYRQISKQVPLKLEGKPPEPESTWFNVLFWVLTVLNVTASICYYITMYVFWTDVKIYMIKPEPWARYMKIASTYGTRLVAIIAGVILLQCIMRIRNYFRDRNAVDFINTGMLLRHASAFGLYLFGTTASSVALMFVNLYPD